MSRYPPPSGSKVYVGGLDPAVQEQELYDIFARAPAPLRKCGLQGMGIQYTHHYILMLFRLFTAPND